MSIISLPLYLSISFPSFLSQRTNQSPSLSLFNYLSLSPSFSLLFLHSKYRSILFHLTLSNYISFLPSLSLSSPNYLSTFSLLNFYPPLSEFIYLSISLSLSPLPPLPPFLIYLHRYLSPLFSSYLSIPLPFSLIINLSYLSSPLSLFICRYSLCPSFLYYIVSFYVKVCSSSREFI